MTYQPTPDALKGTGQPQAKAVPLTADVAKGVDLLHDALSAEFTRTPFTVQAQAALARIDRVVKEIRGNRP